MKKPQQPLTDKLELDRQQAIAAKRALQSALERVNRVHAQLLPGQLQADLDHAARELSVGITALRDADGEGYGVSGDGTRKSSIITPNVKCPKCGHEFRTRATDTTTCSVCKKTVRINRHSLIGDPS